MNTEVTKRAVPNLKGSIREVPRTDTTLTKEGYSADAKVVGDKFAEHKLRIDNIDPHFAENVGYDNTNSGLNATDVQGAIDEIWERETPKLLEGVEYRTTEKWMGKAVYTKLIKITWAKDTVHTISNFEGKTVHKYFGKIGTWTLPFMYQGKTDGDYSAVVSIHKNNDDLKISMYGGSSISGTLELQLWYIKD